MAQFARPSSDISVGTWTPTPLYQQIDEVTPSDADYIQSALNPANDTCEVKLSAVEDPQGNTGHKVRYRYKKDASGGNQVDLTVKLMCAAVEIASWTHTDIPETITPAEQTLTGPQADAITDYSNLRLRFIANKP
jgi:hypothetical protein